MAIKKFQEIKSLSKNELLAKLREAEEQLFRNKLQHVTGQLVNPKSMWKARKDIARMKMLLGSKSA